MNVVYVQPGDFLAAVDRMARGEPETYQAQDYTVGRLVELGAAHSTTVICLNGSAEDRVIAGGRVNCLRRPLWHGVEPGAIVDLVRAHRPDAVVCRTPVREVLRWCARRGVACLPWFADYINRRTWRERWRAHRLVRVLRAGAFPCVSNHNLNASESLARAGVPSRRIVPWDYPPLTPSEPHKAFPPRDRPWQMLYAGVVRAAKGVPECIDVVARLDGAVRLTVAGGGAVDVHRDLAAARGVSGSVEFLGTVPYVRVRALMREHDLVVVPSRHDYPEGLPNTIFEALASRTPLIVSDHPAFRGRLQHGTSAMVFKAGAPGALAEAIGVLMHDPAVYKRLSLNSGEALRHLYVGMEWGEVLAAFLRDPGNQSGWVEANSLAVVRSRCVQHGSREGLAAGSPVSRGMA
jgi:glycosyltransferase involved in cell wall biosynthesis